MPKRYLFGFFVVVDGVFSGVLSAILLLRPWIVTSIIGLPFSTVQMIAVMILVFSLVEGIIGVFLIAKNPSQQKPGGTDIESHEQATAAERLTQADGGTLTINQYVPESTQISATSSLKSESRLDDQEGDRREDRLVELDDESDDMIGFVWVSETSDRNPDGT